VRCLLWISLGQITRCSLFVRRLFPWEFVGQTGTYSSCVAHLLGTSMRPTQNTLSTYSLPVIFLDIVESKWYPLLLHLLPPYFRVKLMSTCVVRSLRFSGWQCWVKCVQFVAEVRVAFVHLRLKSGHCIRALSIPALFISVLLQH
jgi:hypothetical protein